MSSASLIENIVSPAQYQPDFTLRVKIKAFQPIELIAEVISGRNLRKFQNQSQQPRYAQDLLLQLNHFLLVLQQLL